LFWLAVVGQVQQQQPYVVAAGSGHDEDEDGDGSNARNILFESMPSQKPQDLYELWDEYENGIGDRKAAKYVTASHETERAGENNLHSMQSHWG